MQRFAPSSEEEPLGLTNAHLLRRLRMPDTRALVNDKDPGLFVHLDDGNRGRTAGRLGYFDAFFDDDFGVLFVGRGRDRGEEREVDGAAHSYLISQRTMEEKREGERTKACR